MEFQNGFYLQDIDLKLEGSLLVVFGFIIDNQEARIVDLLTKMPVMVSLYYYNGHLRRDMCNIPPGIIFAPLKENLKLEKRKMKRRNSKAKTKTSNQTDGEQQEAMRHAVLLVPC